MKVNLNQIAHARSGDKGQNSNVGIFFQNDELYQWAKKYLTNERIKSHFGSLVKGKVERYEMDNLFALNFILGDSLGGGGSESLINDAQGKTHGQAMLLMSVKLPQKLEKYV